MKRRQRTVTLLGIWNQLPLNVWVWLNDASLKQLEQLTGVRLGVFCYLKNDLNHECFLKKDTDALRRRLERLSDSAQQRYVKKITDDYYRKVVRLQTQLTIAERKATRKLSNLELADAILALAGTWSAVTMNIWYAVLLDIWYPGLHEKNELKKIIAKARDHCGHLHERSDAVERLLYLKVAKRLGLSIREVYYLTQPEIAQGLHGTRVSKKEIAGRMKQLVICNHEGSVRVYGGDHVRGVLREYALPAVGGKQAGDLAGTSACRGKIKGIARVILLDKEFGNFRHGEILVSLQTMIYYLPLMKKAKAILTEFGGLTSHAAIVSRELNIPCIVGITGLISSVKTGDSLIVDATRGVVKKL